MTIGINGMAHVILTVSRFEVAREFYRKLLPDFGMKPVFDGDGFFYCVGAELAVRLASPPLRDQWFADSPVERDGFELLVRRHESPRFPKHPG
jgi:hypothetical protein